MRILRKLAEYRRDERGVTILEYGLIIAVTSLVILAAANLMGASLINSFETVSNKLDSPDGN